VSVNYQSVTLNPGESFSVNTPGKCFVCDTATGDFELRAGDQSPITFSAKRTFGSSTSPVVQRWAIKDLSGAPNTIVFGISMADVKIETSIGTFAATVTTSGKNASTYTKATDVLALVSGNTHFYSGLDGSKVRKALHVQSLAASAGNLQIIAADGKIGWQLAPGEKLPFALETNSALTIKADGGDISYMVLSVIYS